MTHHTPPLSPSHPPCAPSVCRYQYPLSSSPIHRKKIRQQIITHLSPPLFSPKTQPKPLKKKKTYINPHHRPPPLFTPIEKIKQRNTTPTPGAKHMPPLARPVFIPSEFFSAAQPFDVVRVRRRVDVQVAVFGADGAVAVVGG